MIVGWDMCEKRKNAFIILLMILFTIALTGCETEGYVSMQAETMVKQGQPLLEDYISKLSEKASITYCGMINGCNKGDPAFSSRYPSHIVEAQFKAGDAHYTAIVNLEDEKVYSNYEKNDPNEVIREQLLSYCEKYGFDGDINVTGAFYSYAFVSHDVEIKNGVSQDTYVYIDNIPNLAPIGEAEGLLDASLSGFNIEYETDEDTHFSPMILYDYLQYTGNYRKENMRGDLREYSIKGGMKSNNYVNLEPAYYEMDMTFEDNSDDMTCDIRRWDYMEAEGFRFVYVGGVKTGNVMDIETEDYIACDCPFSIDGNELIYEKNDNNPYEAYLYLTDDKWNEINRTCYRLENIASEEATHNPIDRWELVPSAPEELEMVESQSFDGYELYIKGTENKCEYNDDKIVIVFN